MRAAGDESDSDSDDFLSFTGLAGYEHEHQNQLVHIESREFQSEQQLVEPGRSDVNGPIKTLEMCQNLEDFRIAAMNGNLEMIDKFVTDGFDVNDLLKGGWTALLYSCSGGFYRVVQYLIEHGADPNIGKDRYSPLMAACASAKPEDDVLLCVRHLLNAGAKINIVEKHEMTPLMFAAKTGKLEVVKLLIEGGADVNAKDSRGWQPLWWATNFGHGDVVKFLLEKGADPKHLGDDGETVQEVATNKGYNQIAEVLHQLQDSEDLAEIADLPFLNDLPKKEISKLPSETTSKKFEKYGDLEMFLVGLQLSELITLFQENQISFQMLLTLSDEELIKLGIAKLGVRTQILDAIRDVHKKDWTTNSIPTVRNKRHISCPEAFAIVGNISKHLRFIQSTMTYLHKQGKMNPQDLEMGKNDVNVLMLLQETERACVSLSTLETELWQGELKASLLVLLATKRQLRGEALFL
uniref:Ankyrin repeat, SAM and basic leucine zipper domain-containing protein 1 n=1 Tax=Strigamia maritima TaxID=126957 RepID=T1J4E4_STRMM